MLEGYNVLSLPVLNCRKMAGEIITQAEMASGMGLV
jgi:hypothetical protein